jgi:Asp-tRNA(Asn)/Glu-tRNA(Gln) amidotransferase A subunit family amidase
MATDPELLDATDQASLIRSGEISPAELADRAIARIERMNPRLNAVVIPLFEKGRAEARSAPGGPFRGVPYLLKDLSLVSAGDPTSQGMAGAKAAGYRADHDSWFVERMRAAGFVLLGKTNLDELGMGTSTAPAAWGPTRNPWDVSRSPGGSSGGSAAAVAARLVPVADGTDAAGSIRIPASHCGVVGLKPSRGRVSVGPDVFCDSLAGVAAEMGLTRSVRDTAAVLDVVAGHRPGDAYRAPPPARPFAAEVGADPGRLRIGVLAEDPSGAAPVDPGCAAAARAAADALSGLGHDVAGGFPPALARGGVPEFGVAMAVVAARAFDVWEARLGRPLTEDDVEPATWGAARFGRTVTGVQYATGVDRLRERAAEIERWWLDDGWDLLLTPTVPGPAPPIGAAPHADPMLFTSPFNGTGQPAISLPLHESADGLPIGVQLVAAHGREDLLLRVAAQLERALPWTGRHPQA